MAKLYDSTEHCRRVGFQLEGDPRFDAVVIVFEDGEFHELVLVEHGVTGEHGQMNERKRRRYDDLAKAPAVYRNLVIETAANDPSGWTRAGKGLENCHG